MRKFIPIVLGALLSAQSAFAFDLYVLGEAIAIIVNTIAEVFSPDFIYLYPGAQEGLMRALIFALVLVGTHAGLHKGASHVLNDAAQWIVALVIASFSLLAPNSILLSSLLVALIPLLTIGILVVLAMWWLRGDKMHDLGGLILLIIAFFIAVWWVDIFNNQGVQLLLFEHEFVDQFVNMLSIIVFVLIIFKGFKVLFLGWGK
ncbi:MAG: hypothetical protein OXR66_02060 [Candidatus Woesearchaeota archaeon]|nr:hypothetical protein [Candidatus Woesearchaeota archaeon]